MVHPTTPLFTMDIALDEDSDETVAAVAELMSRASLSSSQLPVCQGQSTCVSPDVAIPVSLEVSADKFARSLPDHLSNSLQDATVMLAGQTVKT